MERSAHVSVNSLEAAAESRESREARAKEYGKYRALDKIDTEDGVRVFNAGDRVPISHVEGTTREVQTTEYDPESGEYVGSVKDGKPVTHSEKVEPTIDRSLVYQVGGKDDPHMPARSGGPAATDKPKG
jgi:hypothetical protein